MVFDTLSRPATQSDKSWPTAGKQPRGVLSESCYVAIRFSTLPPGRRGKELLWHFLSTFGQLPKMNVCDDDLFYSVAKRFTSAQGPPMPDWGLCAMAWAYDVVDAPGEVSDFKDLRDKETKGKGFLYSHVRSCPGGFNAQAMTSRLRCLMLFESPTWFQGQGLSWLAAGAEPLPSPLTERLSVFDTAPFECKGPAQETGK